jgi:hypothetical protein
VTLYERHVDDNEGGRCVVARPKGVTYLRVERPAILRCMGPRGVNDFCN